MTQRLLDGLRVLDLGGDPSAAPAGCSATSAPRSCASSRPVATRSPPTSLHAWNAGKQVVKLAADDPALDALLADADVVIDELGAARERTNSIRTARPHAVWVRISPFGSEGPRAAGSASDLGVMASSGNMYCTGDPDRAPIRSTEPTGYAHSGPEAAFAAMTALARGLPQRVDVSMQEVVLVAQHGRARALPRDRHGAAAGAAPTSAVRARSGRRSTGSCRSGCAAARRASRASRSSPSSSRATVCDADALVEPRLERLQPEHRDRRGARRDRSRVAAVLRRATRCKSSTTSRSRPT